MAELNSMTGHIQVNGLSESDISGSIKIVGLKSYNDIVGTIKVKAIQMKNLWLYATTSDKFNLLAEKDDDSLYFLEDTKEIYKGAVLYSGAIDFFSSTLPSKPAKNKLYFNLNTLQGYTWTGVAWKSVAKPIMSFVDATSDDMVSGKAVGAAVKEYTDKIFAQLIAGSVTDLSYDQSTKAIKFVKDSQTHDVPLTKICRSLTYDSQTGKLSTIDSKNNEINSVNIPLDNYVVDGSYNDSTKCMELLMKNGDMVSISAADLVKIYHSVDTKTAKISIANINGNNVITVDIKVSVDSKNAISIKDDGLFIDKDAIAKIADASKQNNIIIIDKDGNRVNSDVNINDIATKTYVNNINTELDTLKAANSNVVNNYAQLNTQAPRQDMIISEAVITSVEWVTI